MSSPRCGVGAGLGDLIRGKEPPIVRRVLTIAGDGAIRLEGGGLVWQYSCHEVKSVAYRMLPRQYSYDFYFDVEEVYIATPASTLFLEAWGESTPMPEPGRLQFLSRWLSELAGCPYQEILG